MVSFSYRIKDSHGIHARPAGLLAKLAQKYDGTVLTIEKNGKSVNLDRVLALLGLGIKHGDTVTVTASGEKEQQALAETEKFFRENL